jgi:hypothetical protein
MSPQVYNPCTHTSASRNVHRHFSRHDIPAPANPIPAFLVPRRPHRPSPLRFAPRVCHTGRPGCQARSRGTALYVSSQSARSSRHTTGEELDRGQVGDEREYARVNAPMLAGYVTSGSTQLMHRTKNDCFRCRGRSVFRSTAGRRSRHQSET